MDTEEKSSLSVGLIRLGVEHGIQVELADCRFHAGSVTDKRTCYYGLAVG